MTRIPMIVAVAGALVASAAAPAGAAVWRGHTVNAKFTGQIDASPCPDASCLRGVVGVMVDRHDVADHLVRCAWPRHPRVVGFDHGHHHHRLGYYAHVRTCGRYYWWRFR